MIFNLAPPESTAVEFIEQTLTDAQKAQARTNIGALDSSSLVSTLTMLGYTKVATGSYVGDGKGKGVNFTKFEYMIDDSNAKTINLPFAPTLLLLTCKQYSGVMIMYPDTYYNADGGVKSDESGTRCAFTGTKLVVTGNTSTTSPIGGSGNTSGNKYTYIVFA